LGFLFFSSLVGTLRSEDETIESDVEEGSDETHVRRKSRGSETVSTDFDQN